MGVSKAAIQKIILYLDTANEGIGRICAWLILPLVFGVFLSVVLRYLFAQDVIWLQELNVYLHALLFISVAGYALKHGAHVRVDVLSQRLPKKTNAIIEMIGTILLLFPVFALLLNDAFFFVLDSWLIQEGSQMTGGLPLMYIFKTFLLVLPVVLILQGISQGLKAFLIFRGEDDGASVSDTES